MVLLNRIIYSNPRVFLFGFKHLLNSVLLYSSAVSFFTETAEETLSVCLSNTKLILGYNKFTDIR